VASIHDPLRRSLLEFVSASAAPVGRDEAAVALGVARNTAAFHLDRLERDGLLIAEFRRMSGKTGPGSGRPAKLYRITDQEFGVSIPERHYDLAASLLASAIEESQRTGEPVQDALNRVAADEGRERGARATTLRGVLHDTGYEPRDDGEGGMTLANCPFHRLATSHTDLICHANVALLRGAAEGANDTEHNVVFDPAQPHCCVRLTPADGSASS
jgi:predicted ArsR family transcriptional regulator